jgi:hypothetical protein
MKRKVQKLKILKISKPKKKLKIISKLWLPLKGNNTINKIYRYGFIYPKKLILFKIIT